VLDAIASQTDVFLLRNKCVSSLSLLGFFFFKQNELFSTLKILICKKYSYKKLTQFSQGNNMPNAAAPNIIVFFGEIQVFLQLKVNRHVWRKQSLSPPEIPKLQEIFLSKTDYILTGKQCASCSCF
jgi:hypothetical protein